MVARHDHGASLAKPRLWYGITFADVGFVDHIHKWIQREPINSVGVIAAHKDHNLGSYADVIPDVELIDFPTRLPLAADLVTVQITDDWALKSVIPTITNSCSCCNTWYEY